MTINYYEASMKTSASSSSSVLSFSRRKMKARAPPPPGKPVPLSVHGDQRPPCDAALSSQQNLIHMKEALQNSTLDITVVLPSGLEKQSVVNGR